jgi:hypothetical protein
LAFVEGETRVSSAVETGQRHAQWLKSQEFLALGARHMINTDRPIMAVLSAIESRLVSPSLQNEWRGK